MRANLIQIALVVTSYLLGYFFGAVFGIPYAYFFSTSGTFVTPSAGLWIVGAPLAIVFLAIFFLYSYGKENVTLWAIVATLPVALFELRFDFTHIYMPILYGIVAWVCGMIAHKFLVKAKVLNGDH